MPITRVIIAHGYGAKPADHWFPWLVDELTKEGVSVIVPALPDSDAPTYESWVSELSEVLRTPDEQTAIVGHSLGTVTALHALDRVEGNWSLGAFISVAGFVSPLPVLPQLDPFTAARPDVARTSSRAAVRTVVQSDGDPYVPTTHTTELGEFLGAERLTVAGAGHFLADDGVLSLPPVLEQLRSD